MEVVKKMAKLVPYSDMEMDECFRWMDGEEEFICITTDCGYPIDLISGRPLYNFPLDTLVEKINAKIVIE